MGRIRIVAGRLKGRRLRVPDDPALRPTGERVREALFDILGQDLAGLDVLDLYAGTGALGFEAASRGARRVVFVESSPVLARAIREAAQALGLGETARVVVGQAETELDPARLGGPFDVVLADPPYGSPAGESALVDRIAARGILAPGGTLVFERSARSEEPSAGTRLRRCRTATYGETALDFFKFS